MAGEAPFEPDVVEVSPTTDRQRVTLTFRSDSGGTREVIVPRATIPELIARLVAEIGPGQGVPIAGSLRPGLTIQVQGFGARRHQDGSADLTIFAHLPDEHRDVTIPLELSAADADELISMLSR